MRYLSLLKYFISILTIFFTGKMQNKSNFTFNCCTTCGLISVLCRLCILSISLQGPAVKLTRFSGILRSVVGSQSRTQKVDPEARHTMAGTRTRPQRPLALCQQALAEFNFKLVVRAWAGPALVGQLGPARRWLAGPFQAVTLVGLGFLADRKAGRGGGRTRRGSRAEIGISTM